MKLLLIVLSFLFCVCYNKSTKMVTVTNQSVSNIQSKTDTVYNRDKSHIANAFVANVETIRKMKTTRDTQTNIFYYDPANIYSPYAIRYNTESKKYEGSPLPTSEQISVNTDTIVYSQDSLLCVAFITIYNHFTDIPPYEPKAANGKYDGQALIGYRNSIRDQLKIYPFKMYEVYDFIFPEDVKNLLTEYYFHEIVGKIAPMGTNIEGIEYTCGLGDPKFFEEAPNFIKDNGQYRFEFYRDGNKELPYMLI